MFLFFAKTADLVLECAASLLFLPAFAAVGMVVQVVLLHEMVLQSCWGRGSSDEEDSRWLVPERQQR